MDQSDPLESNVADAIAVNFLSFWSIQRHRYIGRQIFEQVSPSHSGRIGEAAYAAPSHRRDSLDGVLSAVSSGHWIG